MSHPSKQYSEEDIGCVGCWDGCDECRQPQPCLKHSRSPPPGWECERGSDCGECDFCRACDGPPSAPGLVYEEEAWDLGQKGPGFTLAEYAAPSTVWGWGGRGEDCSQDLRKRSARHVSGAESGSRGKLEGTSEQVAHTGDVVNVRSHSLQQGRDKREMQDSHTAMDARTNNPDNISRADVGDRFHLFEENISARLDRLEKSAGAIPPAARYDQGITAADLDLRDLSKQVLKMSAQQKFQREQSLLDRLTKIEENLKSKDKTSTARLAAQSHVQETLELRELLMKQKWELADLKREVRLLPELRAEVVDLDKEVMWMRERINFLENLPRQRERTGQADVYGPREYASRGYDGSIGQATPLPPGHTPSSYRRAQEVGAGVFGEHAGGEWGDATPAGWSHATPALGSPASDGGWHQVPQSNPSKASFRQHTWGQRSQPRGAGWGSPLYSHGDLDRTNTPVPLMEMLWGNPAQSWGSRTKSPSVVSADFFNRAQRATHEEMGWGSPNELPGETLSMRSPSRPSRVWGRNRWDESPVSLNDLDAANLSTPTRRCPTVETISDADLVSRPSSMGRDWNRVTSRRAVGNEIVPYPASRNKAPSTLQRSDDSWDNVSTVNHPPRPTSSKVKNSRSRSFRSEETRRERDRFGRGEETPSTSWDRSSGGRWGGDREGRLCGGWGGDAGGWDGRGDM